MVTAPHWNSVNCGVFWLMVSAVLLALAFVMVGFATAFALCRFGIMYLYYGDLPCDQPLGWYLVALVVLRDSFLKLRPPLPEYLLGFVVNLAFIAAFPVLGWVLVSGCETCQDTNPKLYDAASKFVWWQVTCGVLEVMLLMFLAVTRRLVLAGVLRPPGRGCQDAVKAMRHLTISSPELVDPQDGQLKECVICMDLFSQSANDCAAVATDCGHYFHEACLMQWCSTHITCPICRGSLDPEAEPVGAPTQSVP